jgi:8-oxo-dGTP pyrophosphatase MutT (NUDIX family)
MVLPRYASTVVLLRPDTTDGFEVLLTRRPEEMRFLGGFYVFPGGTVHTSDYSPEVLKRCRGVSGSDACRILGANMNHEVALGHWVAVVRELFEEVGVLLCESESGEHVAFDQTAVKNRIEQKRQAIVRKQLDIGGFLESENLYCNLDQAVYFDHWVTPEIYSMRFDTRFYIATLPPKQEPLSCSEEVTHSLWITAAEALARVDRRNFPVLPPTTIVLQRLAGLATWDKLRAEFNLS